MAICDNSGAVHCFNYYKKLFFDTCAWPGQLFLFNGPGESYQLAPVFNMARCWVDNLFLLQL